MEHRAGGVSYGVGRAREHNLGDPALEGGVRAREDGEGPVSGGRGMGSSEVECVTRETRVRPWDRSQSGCHV